ncbi:MAG: SLBB domain-containing protein [Treponema sp.]|jgi:protein involved in polysaccharide export with SLBB domain|nr:SLBB domain-containing protein [Treponema sp.]
MIKIKLLLIFGLSFLAGTRHGIFAQKVELPAGTSASPEYAEDGPVLDLVPSAQLALSTPDYPVTAGDIYTLAYLAGTQTVEYTITVDTSYRIRVSNLAVIDTAGKTYNELKTQVETIVTTNHRMSGVQFVLHTPAVFKVRVKGEVRTAAEVSAWALTRLSSLSEYATSYGSLREVSVTSSNGTMKTYDLYRARRMGDIAQDPYLRPNDVITFNRVQRQVTLSGAVERPGTYQLLPGEHLKELIEVYGNGFTPFAETAWIGLIRYVNTQDKVGNKVYLTEDALEENYPLEDYDVVDVPSTASGRPVLFVEGAVGVPDEGQLTASNRITIRFEPGEDYGSLVRRNPDWFSAVSDTEGAYIIRANRRISVNLNLLLYNAESRSPHYVEPNDVLIIPFRQYFVTVSGAVINPGRYPYIPDRDWEYYVALAGGFRKDQNSLKKVTITSMDGHPMTKSDGISPETVITAETNAFLYHFNQVAPVITTTLTLVLTFISIQSALSR